MARSYLADEQVNVCSLGTAEGVYPSLIRPSGPLCAVCSQSRVLTDRGVCSTGERELCPRWMEFPLGCWTLFRGGIRDGL